MTTPNTLPVVTEAMRVAALALAAEMMQREADDCGHRAADWALNDHDDAAAAPEFQQAEILDQYADILTALSAAPATPDAEDAARWRAVEPYLWLETNHTRMSVDGPVVMRTYLDISGCSVPDTSITTPDQFADALRSERGRTDG